MAVNRKFMTGTAGARSRLVPVVLMMFALVASWSSNARAQEQTNGGAADELNRDEGSTDEDRGPESKRVQFSFRSAPWPDVLMWIADQCDLSFNLDYTPKGTFNFVDESRTYTPEEALDEINGALLAKGFTLARRHKSLYIIDLDNDLDKKFIQDLLDVTPVQKLDKVGRFELAKVRFQLRSVEAELADEQIKALIGPQGSIVAIPAARQLIVTETGGNLRTIHGILELIQDRAGELHAFRLQHADGADVLAVAKPLLGIDAERSATEDGTIRISTDSKGKVVYATGSPEKIALAEQIVRQVDLESAAPGATEQLQFISHPVRREDPAEVVSVLESLFSGDQHVRLKARSDSIFAMATTAQHRTIRATIEEIEQNPSRIDVLPLRRNSPTVAVALIERLFGGGSEEDADPDAPVIDAMFEPDQLIVRGNAAQIEQIKELLERMGERFDGPGGPLRGDTTRVLRISRDDLPMAIERLREVWPNMRSNRIRVINQPRQAPLIRTVPHAEDQREAVDRERDTAARPSSRESTYIIPRRGAYEVLMVSQPVPAVTETGDEGGDDESAVESQPAASPEDDSVAATAPSNRQVAAQQTPAEIILTPTPDGLLIASEDVEALDVLEDLLTTVGTPSGGNSRYSLFYLKHLEADQAKTLLTSLFSGGAETSSAPETNSRGGVLGLVGGGTSTLPSAAPLMIADNRLNRLFVQGTPSQLRDVGEYLRFIDMESGPVEVLTTPKPHFIPVFYTGAEEVVDVLKKLYAGRIIDESQGNRRQEGRSFGGFGRRGGFGGRGGDDESNSQSTGDQPKMSVAVEPASNSVVVSAPGPLLKEVEEVVRQIDLRAQTQPAETFRVLTLNTTSPAVVRQALEGVYGDMIQTESSGQNGQNGQNGQTSSSSRGQASSSGRAGGGQTTTDQIQSRIELFNALRSGGGGDRGGFRGGGTGRDRGGFGRGGRGGDGGGDRRGR